MTADVSLKCSCGQVTGRASLAHGGRRLVCLCRSCQGYARFLGRQDEILDGAGGTDLFQMAPAQVRITSGAEQLRAVRISREGPFRWYTDCCKTPVGNTLPGARWPFVGMPHLFMDHQADGQSRDEALGPIQHRIHARHATAPVPGGHPSAPKSLLFGVASGMLGQWLRGLARPSPFFDAGGQPVATPQVLDAEQRKAIGLK